MNKTNELSINELINYYEQKMYEESNSDLYNQYYYTRKYLLELEDAKEDQQFEVGELIWCVNNEEFIETDEEYNYDYRGYHYMASCRDYILAVPEYVELDGTSNFNRQLCEMCDESNRGVLTDIVMFRKRYVYKNEEDAKAACNFLKGEN